MMQKPDDTELVVGEPAPHDLFFFQPRKLEAELHEVLMSELQQCPGCSKMLDISNHHRHQEYGCTMAEDLSSYPG